MGDQLAAISSDWLATIEKGAEGEILWVRLAMIFSNAGKDEKKNFVRNLANDWHDSAVLHYYCP